MKVFYENPNLLIEEYNAIALKAQRKAFITVGIEIQKEEIEFISNYNQKLSKLKKSFVEKNWENEANLVYCIENSLLSIQYEIQMLVNIKEDNMSEAWGNLVNAQSAYGTVVQNSIFEIESDTGYLERLESYEKLIFPPLYFQSIGGIIKESHCSICNAKSGKCKHIKGKLYNGELCTRIITNMELEEISFVEKPANKHCRALSIKKEGKEVDILTLREIEQKR